MGDRFPAQKEKPPKKGEPSQDPQYIPVAYYLWAVYTKLKIKKPVINSPALTISAWV